MYARCYHSLSPRTVSPRPAQFPPTEEDLNHLKRFTDNLLCNETLTSLDLLGNGIGVEGAAVIQPLVTPVRSSLDPLPHLAAPHTSHPLAPRSAWC